MRNCWTLFGMVFVIAVAGAASGENLVVNGDFEAPAVTHTSGWDIYPSGTPGLGWTVAWWEGSTSYNGWTRPGIANLELHNGVSNWLPREGSQYAELDSDWNGHSGNLNNEPASISIYQEIQTLPGLYTVRYSYSPRPNNGDNKLEVYWGGNLVNSHDEGNPGGNTSWTDVVLSLEAGPGATVLEFREVGIANSLGMFLDDVRVEVEELYCLDETVPLCAGQHTNIGTVTVSNDDANLYVVFTIVEPGWYLEETHVAVGLAEDDIPQTKKGNPIPGQFPYTCETHDPMATTCTAVIPLGDWCYPSEIFIAAHAAVAEILGDGCDQMTFWANNAVQWDQGLRKDGGAIAADRSDPTAVFELGGPFYSLGFDLVNDDYADGWLTVEFGHPVYNGPGPDIVVQEVTYGRDGYPLEQAQVFGVENGTDYFAGVVTNKDGGDGLGTADLPSGITTVDAVKLLDDTDPGPHSGNADGYDVDAIGACWLMTGEETAWGDGCDGTQFVTGRGWATYFTYEINGCAPECD